MVTRAIKPKRDDTMLAGWQSSPERAPSVMLEAKPTMTRFLFMVGLLLSAIGTLSLLAVEWRFAYLVSPNWGMFFLVLGLALVLLHAFSEKDEQFRRAYAVTGLMILGLSAALRVLPMGGSVGGRFLTLGFPGLILGLLLVGAVLRHETNAIWRAFLNRILLLSAGLLLVTGIWFVNIYLATATGHNYVGEGTLLMLLGLFFTVVCITFQTEWASYQISTGLGITGLVCVSIGVLRWLMTGVEFLVPSGLVLIVMGLLYICVYLAVSSDWAVVVLTRREFASFFYSPIAYPVLLGLTAIAWINFIFFVQNIDEAQGAMFEPIVQGYIVNLIPVFAQMFVVPILTMRLMSEEQKTGTLEVMLTAPVNESSVVLSKFFGALAFYMMTWAPFFLFLVSLWVFGDRFDYRPMLSFSLAVLASGSGFIAMGLFFSTITRNQIIAAVLCFAGMMVHLAIFLVERARMRQFAGMQDFLVYISFIHLWISSLGGLVAPRFLFFHVSLAIFFLFLTLKFLEARKWK